MVATDEVVMARWAAFPDPSASYFLCPCPFGIWILWCSTAVKPSGGTQTLSLPAIGSTTTLVSLVLLTLHIIHVVGGIFCLSSLFSCGLTVVSFILLYIFDLCMCRLQPWNGFCPSVTEKL